MSLTFIHTVLLHITVRFFIFKSNGILLSPLEYGLIKFVRMYTKYKKKLGKGATTKIKMGKVDDLSI